MSFIVGVHCESCKEGLLIGFEFFRDYCLEFLFFILTQEDILPDQQFDPLKDLFHLRNEAQMIRDKFLFIVRDFVD